jgi:hypothetical protein
VVGVGLGISASVVADDVGRIGAFTLPGLVGQEPQCSELVCRSTQLPSHDVLPAGQPQVPPEHACPLAHLVPQAPHELAVVCRSTQASPQRVRPLGQAWVLGMQLVTAQISPV